MTPPSDPIAQAVKGGWKAPLYRIVGNVYGLQEVIKKLTEANFVSSTLDKMLFEHRGASGELDCLALVYVDDFLITHREDFDFTVLERMFTWVDGPALNKDSSSKARN